MGLDRALRLLLLAGPVDPLAQLAVMDVCQFVVSHPLLTLYNRQGSISNTGTTAR